MYTTWIIPLGRWRDLLVPELPARTSILHDDLPGILPDSTFPTNLTTNDDKLAPGSYLARALVPNDLYRVNTGLDEALESSRPRRLGIPARLHRRTLRWDRRPASDPCGHPYLSRSAGTMPKYLGTECSVIYGLTPGLSRPLCLARLMRSTLFAPVVFVARNLPRRRRASAMPLACCFCARPYPSTGKLVLAPPSANHVGISLRPLCGSASQLLPLVNYRPGHWSPDPGSYPAIGHVNLALAPLPLATSPARPSGP